MSELWQHNATKLGEELAKEHCKSLPVDPLQVAEKLKIHVEPLPSERKSVSGILVYVDNVFGIQYATYIESQGFQNFCISHEIGHYSIPGHPEKLLTNGYHESHAGFSSGEKSEQEADHFAAGLLMPSFLFDPLMNNIQSGLKAVEILAGKCKTSLPATAIRYAQKTPDPVAIIMSEGNVVRYCFMSDEFKTVSDLRWIQKDFPLPRDTVTFRFNQHTNNVISGATAEGEARLLDWFGSRGEYELYEEVMGLGSYGKTLTVLTLESLPDQEEIEEEDEMIESWQPRFKR